MEPTDRWESMKSLDLLPIGDLPAGLLQWLAAALPHNLRVPCEVLRYSLNPKFALHPERLQYHSSELLRRMQEHLRPVTWRALGVAAVDLYIPILTFVFGEAQMGGPCAVVSLHRLRQEFYGLQADNTVLAERLLKEAVHEIGHTLDLIHCEDYRCAMAPSHAVEWIDLKEGALCPNCAAKTLDTAATAQNYPFR
jgi:archaemetzincin